ncbi:MAG TPA: TAT-variant-translocated molybdopterin oxidoreductase [Humisphaera sp.]
MSDRGSSEPVTSPKYLDLKDFVGLKQKVEAAVRQDATVRRPDGKVVYRSLDELAGTAEFRALVDREFPQAASEWDDGVSRRNFMKLMGASLALAGLSTACAPKPEEKIVPYVQQPENIVPGRPLFFASAMPWMGYGKGVVVEQHEGRPTKVEGNRDHPSSRGAADVWGQASILSLYDPDRSQVVTRYGNVATWGQFVNALGDALRYADWQAGKTKGRTAPARVRILTETVTSPTIAAQVAALKRSFPDLVWHAYDAVGRDNVLEGTRLAFGEAAATTAPAAGGGRLEPVYHFDRAKVVVALDCNFLTDEPGSLRYARDYISTRKVSYAGRKDRDGAGLKAPIDVPARQSPASRLYVAESSPTVVGAMADHKLRATPDQIHAFAAALLEAVEHHDHAKAATFAGAPWFNALVEDLTHAEPGTTLVCAGEYAPPAVHVLAHAINAKLGNVATGPDDKKPVSLIPAVVANPVNNVESITKLAADLKADAVDVLLVLGGNPAYTAPAELGFEALLGGIYARKQADPRPFVAHLGMYEDETARACEWHVPETHYLEAWGDVRGHDGTASVVQPLIAPLYPACKSAVEVLAAALEKVPATGSTSRPAYNAGDVSTARSGYDAVRATWQAWQAGNGGGDFEKFWTLSLHDGVIGKVQQPKDNDPFPPAATAHKAVAAPKVKDDAVAAARKVTPAEGLTLNFRPDPNVWDGAWANNAWLQELPKPLTKLTWDNALLISPGAAKDLKLASDDKGNVFKEKFIEALEKTVNITVNGQTLKGVPVWVVPGHPDRTATLHLGYGRRWAGKVGSPNDGQVGFDAYPLRAGATRWSAANAKVEPAGGTYKLAVTQNHQVINHETNHKRELVLSGHSIDEVWYEVATEAGEKRGEFTQDELAARRQAIRNREEKGAALPERPTDNENLKLARKIGLPVLPDDPANSPASLFPDQPDQPAGGHDSNYPAWSMVIDQTACIGCNACVVACQAENNVPVVGKEQVMNEREMQWLRIDTYYVGKPLEGDPDGHSDTVDVADPDHTFFQPMMCVHCEKAPCELVCPVGATVHDKEGLNVMVYNRCVGTRYCSNNCPYKVRRFNFLKYNDDTTPVLKLLRNPEVTVRSRGVMEKCTYCIQRISRGRIEAKKAEAKFRQSPEFAKKSPADQSHDALALYNAELRKVTTACQQSCPTEAIIFGNMADPESDIWKHKREPVGFHYGVLAELNTRPRTTYFARIDNPSHGHAGHAETGAKGGDAGKDSHPGH